MTVPTPELIARVNGLMAQGFELTPEQMVPTARLKDDLGLDSLDAVDMLVYIEERMGVKVDGEKIRELRTLADVYVLAAEAVPEEESPALAK